jgi:anaerobic ribonucleoside-triphosphate reductase
MSVPQRVRGVRVLKAVSSPVRLQILNLLFDKNMLSYTELMGSLKMNPSRDAGRFAYHLKFLLKVDLIEADVDAKKYCLTDLGKMIIDVADRVEKKVFSRRNMLIRTSHSSLEEFDANRIAAALIKEAKMPAELAQKTAKEVEKLLIKSKTKYLTAPLVREVVNAVLIEKGLEEYRHKLTRLGVPVYDVAALLEKRTKTFAKSSSTQENAGQLVFKEYILLNVFPRDIADAHLSGSLHMGNLSSWILQPDEVMHDLRFFLEKGLDLDKVAPLKPSLSAPKDLNSAISVAQAVLLQSAKEATVMQTIDYLNIFLAPFIKAGDPETVKAALRQFILSAAYTARCTLGIELTVPSFIKQKPALGSQGNVAGKYEDYMEETQLLASLLLDVFLEESAAKPLINPKIIVKIRSEILSDQRAKAILLKAHNLAATSGTPFFADLTNESWGRTVFSASGCALKSDVNEDWEIDTLRTGCLGRVAINVPKIVYDCGKDARRFLQLLKERIDMAIQALEIKAAALKHHDGSSTPFLMQTFDSDQYYRLGNSSRLINVVGLKEAAESFSGKSLSESDVTAKFFEETAQSISDMVEKTAKRQGKRILVAVVPDAEASIRLARLDMERYGVGKIRFSGTREKPYYSSIHKILLSEKSPTQSPEGPQSKIYNPYAGGGISVIEQIRAETDAQELFTYTTKLIENHGAELFAYDRKMTYCGHCRKSYFGIQQKCPSCSALGTLRFFDQFAFT